MDKPTYNNCNSGDVEGKYEKRPLQNDRGGSIKKYYADHMSILCYKCGTVDIIPLEQIEISSKGKQKNYLLILKEMREQIPTQITLEENTITNEKKKIEQLILKRNIRITQLLRKQEKMDKILDKLYKEVFDEKEEEDD